MPALQQHSWMYGILMSVLVALVIIGGIKSISKVASVIVPFMCGIYLLACLFILFSNLGSIPSAFQLIISQAFQPDAAFGGFLGVLIIGIKRAVFSNEAGIGSAAIAHSAAKVSNPVEEGTVALLEPFIDTIIVCTMTALVIIITGSYLDPSNAAYISNNQGGH